MQFRHVIVAAALVLAVLAGLALANETRSNSHSHRSHSHHSHSHHSRSHQHPPSHSKPQSHSQSASHHSQSESRTASISPSQSPARTPAFNCSGLVTAGDEAEVLRFAATQLPAEKMTCKGRDYLHDGNSKNTPPNEGVGRRWQQDRECRCPTYRACAERRCVSGEQHLPAIFTVPANATSDLTLCRISYPAPPDPPLLPPTVVLQLQAAGRLPALYYYMGIHCRVRVPGGGGVGVYGTVGVFTVQPRQEVGARVNVTCTALHIGLAGDGAPPGMADMYADCRLSAYSACASFLQPTNYTRDVLGAACTHVRTTSIPHVAAGTVASYAVAGIVGLAVLGTALWGALGIFNNGGPRYSRVELVKLQGEGGGGGGGRGSGSSSGSGEVEGDWNASGNWEKV